MQAQVREMKAFSSGFGRALVAVGRRPDLASFGALASPRKRIWNAHGGANGSPEGAGVPRFLHKHSPLAQNRLTRKVICLIHKTKDEGSSQRDGRRVAAERRREWSVGESTQSTTVFFHLIQDLWKAADRPNCTAAARPGSSRSTRLTTGGRRLDAHWQVATHDATLPKASNPLRLWPSSTAATATASFWRHAQRRLLAPGVV